jgi:molybdate transport system substrate-binding protein
VIATSIVDLARSFVGIAVKAGAPHPDIASVAAFRASVLAARPVAYSKIGASGIYFAGLIERLGIAAGINAKATVASGFTAERLITGEADLAVHIEVVEPIPLSLQMPAVFSAGRMSASQNVAQADACCAISLRLKSRRCCLRPAWSGFDFDGQRPQGTGRRGYR